MFDVGFSELLMIGIVALVVIGPERLPKVARTAGHLFGRMQRYVSTVKADIEREVNMAELKDLQNLKKDVEVLQTEINTAGQEIAQAATANISMAQKSIAEIEAQARIGAETTPSVDSSTAPALTPTPQVERIPELAEAAPEVARPQMELGLEGGELHNPKAA
jgi:sec-independent protein translocase protein TatB